MTWVTRITEARERREAENAERKAANLRSLATVPAHRLHTPTYSGSTSGEAIGKTEPRRNPRLLAMARLMPCLLGVPDVCNGDRETVVACHSNLSIHGKAGARKADDCYVVYGCSACHAWLDQGPAPADEKAAAFLKGLGMQRALYTAIANDPARWSEPARRAAQWAIDQLKEN